MIPLLKEIVSLKNRIKVLNKRKVFCIGLNKTGTTSLKKAMQGLGYVSGDQSKAEKLIYAWAERDFKKITNYCFTAQFFQDIPFSLPYTYVILDQTFPRSKFILTIRDTPDEWYRSLTSFHSKMWGNKNRIPRKQDLENALYRTKGGPWEANRLIFNTPETDPYNKAQLVEFYNQHNKQVKDYFKNRPEDLLILNVAEKCAFKKLCMFLSLDYEENEFPWENKTL